MVFQTKFRVKNQVIPPRMNNAKILTKDFANNLKIGHTFFLMGLPSHSIDIYAVPTYVLHFTVFTFKYLAYVRSGHVRYGTSIGYTIPVPMV
jgi:hypothetical protein